MKTRTKISYGKLSKAAGLCSAALLLFACAKDPTAAPEAAGERLRFEVSATDGWNQAGPEPHAAAENTSAAPKTRSGSVDTLTRTFPLQGERLEDTLFLHASVSDGIEGARLGRPAPLTKGAPVTDAAIYGSFGVSAFMYAGAWEDQSASLMPDFMYNVQVNHADGLWTPSASYYWPKGKKLTFFAYAPYNGEGITLSPKDRVGAPTLGYTVPAEVAEQKDLLVSVLKDQTGGADASSASLTFDHALTAVKFSCGADMGSGTIKSITLKGVCSEGTFDFGAGAWSDLKTPVDFGLTLDKKTDGTPGSAITADEATFMMLPQTLPSGAQIEVLFNDGATDYTLTADIGGTTWPKGQTVNYKISSTSINWDYTLEVTPPAEDFTYQGGSKTYTVKSFRSKSGGTTETAAWTAQFSTDGGKTWTTTKPAWLTAFTDSGSGSTTTAGENCTATVAKQEATTSGGSDHTQVLQNAAPKGTQNDPYDLSMYDIDGNPQPGMTTANCYVVRAPGWYRIPLVYGNAVKNGTTNKDAYDPGNGGTIANGIGTFLRHDNQPITGPTLADNGFTASAAAMVWNDANANFVAVNSTLSTYTATIDGTAKSLQYLVFEMPKDNIMQGNAVIAVKSGTTTLWSWHVWVTDEDLTPIGVTNYMDEVNDMMPVNLGWCSAGTSTTTAYAERSCQVRLTQTASGKSQTFTLTQAAYSFSTSSTAGNSPYYQWGRKDPFPPSIGGTSSTDKPCYSATVTGGKVWSYSSSSVTIGMDIQNPTVHYYSSSTSGPCNRTYYNMWSARNTKANVQQTVADEPVVKTVYDPCPPGFHVAPTNAFTGFTTTGGNTSTSSQWNVSGSFNRGWNFYTGKNKTGGTIWFPDSGYRDSSSGALNSVAGYGFYWAAVPYSATDGRYLFFNSTYVYPLRNYNRSYGFPVRPVQEKAGK